MPHPERKKQRLEGHRCNDEAAVDNNDFQASIESLSGDVIANIFGFLQIADVLRARLNKKMREAAKNTAFCPTEFKVDSAEKHDFMSVIAAALPNLLQKISLRCLGEKHKYVDGEDPVEDLAAGTAGYTTHDVGVISNLRKLRELDVYIHAQLNGRYSVLFNFPHLQKLSIRYCDYLKFDLEMLAGLRVLKELDLTDNNLLRGNINSLRALKDTLEKVKIERSGHAESDFMDGVEGDFMDLADFPHLKKLELYATAVTGDIRDIGEKDFSSLKDLTLPKGVYGGAGHEFQRISDAKDVIMIPYRFDKQRPEIRMFDGWHGTLSEDSPDWYESFEDHFDATSPLYISNVRAGNRVGYQWTTYEGDGCEVNWLDPEPDRESSDYRTYMEELQKIEGRVTTFKGFHQPPTQEEYKAIMERIYAESSDDDSDDADEIEDDYTMS